MAKPKTLVLSGYGFNCEEETHYAFEQAGAVVATTHINDIIESPSLLHGYQIIAFPGGFSYGDDTGSGNAFANKVRNHMWEPLMRFIEKDTLVIGICNGFQVLVSLGLLPGLNRKYGEKEVTLLHNENAKYTVRWVDLAVANDKPWLPSRSPWLMGVESISVPIAHGEGKFYAPEKIILRLKEKNMIALKYTKGKTCLYQSMDANPNGSTDDIAGITDETGRIFGLMPHPERALFAHQLPYFQVQKEFLHRQKQKIPQEGPGMQIFKNAVAYFQ